MIKIQGIYIRALKKRLFLSSQTLKAWKLILEKTTVQDLLSCASNVKVTKLNL